MRCLVTGGAGSLGTAVCSRLLRDGHAVVIYDLAPSRLTDGRLASVQGDINDDLRLVQTIADHHLDTIFHLASLLSIESSTDPVAAVRINSGGMATVLEVARTVGARKVVWASSNGVFARYNSPAPIANDSVAYYPNNVYAGTKVLNELLAKHYADTHGLDVIGLRLTLMMGTAKPRGRSGEVSAQLVENPLAGRPGRVRYGDDIPSWLWVDDAARALVLAAMTGRTKSNLFNISGDTRSFSDAVRIVRGLIPGADITLEPGYYVTPHGIDTQTVEEELGFYFEWTLEKQLAELINRARER
ncbi:MAG: NAD-dependent epimerase/dehydratase family protein [Dehalococcoidia bacterium]